MSRISRRMRFSVHRMALVLQVPGHLPDAVERRFEELLIDQRIRARFISVSPFGA
jgi:hypothetical protein